jgi:hypothetical protein
MEELTIKQAIEHGYTSYLYPDEGFQSAGDLSYPEYIVWSRKPVLSDKEPYHPAGIDAAEIIELVAETIDENHSSDSLDYTGQVYEAIKSIDKETLNAFISAVEEKLSSLNYYRGSEISLIP